MQLEHKISFTGLRVLCVDGIGLPRQPLPIPEDVYNRLSKNSYKVGDLMTSTNGSNGNGYAVPKPRAEWIARRKAENRTAISRRCTTRGVASSPKRWRTLRTERSSRLNWCATK